MDFKVIFKDPFLEDLEEIIRTIAKERPLAARRLGEVIVESAESLSFFPERYPRVRQRPGIRRVVIKKRYKVFYRVVRDTGTVEVLRCWDGSRGQEPNLQ